MPNSPNWCFSFRKLEMHRKFQSKILKEMNHFGDLGVDGRVSRVKRGRVEVCEVESAGSQQCPLEGSFGMYTELSDFVKD
jgi:hypothetical protein